jgi:subtilisin
MPEVTSARQPYMVAQSPVAVADVAPINFDDVRRQLEADPEVDVQRVIEPRGLTVLGGGGPPPNQSVLVVNMSAAKAADLDRNPQLIVEPDHPITLPTIPPLAAAGTAAAVPDPAIFIPYGISATWNFEIVDDQGKGIPEAAVYLYGSTYPVQAVTDDQGRASVTLINETTAEPRALYVDPKSSFWDVWIDSPQLAEGSINTVTLQPLSSMFPGFPQVALTGWGETAMGLDQLPRAMTGAGVKVAIIDSGAASHTHPDLSIIHTGQDLTQTPATADGWATDTVAHGSHCSGIVAGSSTPATGIHGFAPSAEVHELKIFPGGRFSTLLDAIDYCMANEIDVVNMSLGSPETSDLLTQKISQAKQQGVALVVAAGNSAGPVQFPGNLSDVLAVAAIGKTGTYPENSYHAQQTGTAATDVSTGYFSAKFSCFGPEVDVCGPGVAIISSVPPDGYAAWDGTSMSTPHVTGLAALILAHHPDFTNGQFAQRDAARVGRLFTILKESSTAVDVGDPTRTGAGLPNAARALQTRPAVAAVGALPQDSTLLQVCSYYLTILYREMTNAGIQVPAPASPLGSMPITIAPGT